jgi:hypothetical protein
MFRPLNESASAVECAQVAMIERELMARDGLYFAGERYFGNAFDAERQRHWLAERLAREAERRERYLSTRAAA